MVGPGGLLAGITRTVLESALDAEMDAHLDTVGVDEATGRRANVRNGHGAKRVCQTNGVTRVVEGYLRPVVRRPSKAISKAFRAGFQRMVHLRRPCPVGSRLITAR